MEEEAEQEEAEEEEQQEEEQQEETEAVVATTTTSCLEKTINYSCIFMRLQKIAFVAVPCFTAAANELHS